MSSKHAINNSLHNLQEICLNRNIPFVSYSLPHVNNIITLIQYQSFPRKLTSLNQINDQQGFIVAPFLEEQRFPVYFLEPDIKIEGTSVEETLLNKLSTLNFSAESSLSVEEGDYIVAGKEEYMEQVSQIKSAIKEGAMDKAVLSRLQLVPKNKNTGPLEVFYALCDKYPRAFKYVFNIPGAGCWLGATPEPLVEIINSTVETVSLAGTQKLNGVPVESVQWQLKELEEQKFVTDFIEERLHKFGVTDFVKKGPFNQQAANLVHLKSVFSFDSSVLKGRTGEFITMLHPTPSVCGLPRKKAYQFLKHLEKHNREYYTGFLGLINIDNSTRLYVNLRCMKTLEHQFALFMGAGITSGSNPESEWEETNQKMMTMLNVINSFQQ